MLLQEEYEIVVLGQHDRRGSRAARKISRSSASRRPTCLMERASIPDSAVIHGASAGESCASIQKITQPGRGDPACGRRTAGQR